jgi:Zn-dependent M28 family amino/carboxypeptidase
MEGLLREWADTVQLLPFQYLTSGGENLQLTNILARFRPEADHRILFLTHWDTRPWSDRAQDPELREIPVPGANDGASGTAVLLHLASLLSESPPPSGIDFLFIDGEDYGPGVEDMFMGSRHFVQTMREHGSWTYGVLLDMVGDRDPSFPVEAYSAEFATGVVQRVWRIADDLGYGDVFPNRVGPRVSDDHVYFNQAGLPTVDIIDFEYGPGDVDGGRFWHTPDDDLENVSAETLGMVGEVVAELVYRGG